MFWRDLLLPLALKIEWYVHSKLSYQSVRLHHITIDKTTCKVEIGYVKPYIPVQATILSLRVPGYTSLVLVCEEVVLRVYFVLMCPEI